MTTTTTRAVDVAVSVPPITNVEVRAVTGSVVVGFMTDDFWTPLRLYLEPGRARELAAELVAVAEQAEVESNLLAS